jgi:hypothetical protein
VLIVFLQQTHVSSGGLAREQENPEVRGGVGIANQCSSIDSSHKSTTSSSSYSSPIVQARPAPFDVVSYIVQLDAGAGDCGGRLQCGGLGGA